jgi:hypothetical protein
VKLALVNKADLFGIRIGNSLVERVLDVSYFLMMIGFLVGVFFIVQFMTTYVSGDDYKINVRQNEHRVCKAGLLAAWTMQ